MFGSGSKDSAEKSKMLGGGRSGYADLEEGRGATGGGAGAAGEAAAGGAGWYNPSMWSFKPLGRGSTDTEATEDTSNASTSTGTEEVACFGELPFSTRLQVFIVCQILAVLTNAVAWLALGTGRYTRSVALTTMANLVALAGTMFLMGMKRQCQSMFDPVRRSASMIYLGAMFGTIFVAIFLQSTLLCLVLSIVQYLALIWYSLSYVPYGRAVVTNALKGCVKMVISV